MRTTSALYKQLRSLPGSHYKVKVICGLTEYGMNVLKSVQISTGLFMESGPSIGNACSARCDVKLIGNPVNWPRMESFEVKIQLLSEDETQASEWLTMGTFYTDERSYEGNTLTISGYDIMLMTEQSWTDKITPPVEWPVTAKAWCDMIEDANLFEFDSRSQLDNSIAFVGLDTTSTIREKLKDIASAHGANWVITPEGKLRLIPFSNLLLGDCAIAGIAIAGSAVVGRDHNTEYKNYIDLGANMKRFNRSTEFHATTGVSLKTDDGYESFSGNNTGYVFNGVCNFTNRDDVANVALNRLNGYIYRPFNADSAYLDPAAELGDMIDVDSVNYQIMLIDWNINNMPTANISAEYEEEIDHEYVIESPEARTYQKLVKDSAVDNLIPFPYTLADSGSDVYGLSWVTNDDGSITFNGTVSGAPDYAVFALSTMVIADQLKLGFGTYTASCRNSGGGIWFQVGHKYQQGGSTLDKIYAQTIYGPVTFEIPDDDNDVYYAICFNNGTVLNNLTLYPMVEAGPVAHDWVSPAESFRSLIKQNANSIELNAQNIALNAQNIALKVSKGDVASELTVECTDGTGYVNVGTDRFTVNSTNFKLDRNGNVQAGGAFSTKYNLYETRINAGFITQLYNDSVVSQIYSGISSGLDVTFFNQSSSGGSGKSWSFDAKNNGNNSTVLINDGISQETGFTGCPDKALIVIGAHIADVCTQLVEFGSASDFKIGGSPPCSIALYSGYLPNNPDHTGNGKCLVVTGDGMIIAGGLYVYGAKNRVVKTKNYDEVGLNAVESTEALFSDFGSGKIDESGQCYVFFDPIFEEVIDTETEYYVSTTQTSMGQITCVEKEKQYFVVHGSSGTSFDWIVYARQIDSDKARLPKISIDKEPVEEEKILEVPLTEQFYEANRTMAYMEELEIDYDLFAEQYLNLYEEEIEDYVY